MIEFRRDVEDIVRGIKFVVGGTVDCFTHVSYWNESTILFLALIIQY